MKKMVYVCVVTVMVFVDNHISLLKELASASDILRQSILLMFVSPFDSAEAI